MTTPLTKRQQIAEVLRKRGAMTSQAIADRLGWETRTVTSTIASARWEQPERLFRIVRYQPSIGRRTGDLPMYVAQPGPDVPRPPYNPKERRRAITARHRQKYRALYIVRNRVRKARQRGEAPTVNLWQQLLPPGVRLDAR